MKNILKVLGLTGEKGLIGLISEKTGKISFKRSAAIMLITAVAIPDYLANGLTLYNMALMVGCLATVALPKIFSKDSE